MAAAALEERGEALVGSTDLQRQGSQTAAEAGLLACADVPRSDGGGCRVGVVARGRIEPGAVIERCCARIVPAWQASSDFVWFFGAYPAQGLASSRDAGANSSEPRPRDRDDDTEEEAVLPFGWGMLYADTSWSALPANVSWRVEQDSELERREREQSMANTGDEPDSAVGRPCWLVLMANCQGPAIRQGDELIVHRAIRRGADAEALSHLLKGGGGVNNEALARLAQIDPSCFWRKEDPAEQGREWVRALPRRASAADGGCRYDGVRHPASEVLRLGLSERHGVGVFARRPIARGEVVEVAPTVVVEDAEVPSYGGTFGEFSHVFSDYTFDGRMRGPKISCLPLGFGGLYNHAARPNVEQRWAFAEDPEALRRLEGSDGEELPSALDFCYGIVALRDIAEGEEVLQDYGVTYWQARGVLPC